MVGGAKLHASSLTTSTGVASSTTYILTTVTRVVQFASCAKFNDLGLVNSNPNTKSLMVGTPQFTTVMTNSTPSFSNREWKRLFYKVIIENHMAKRHLK